MKKLRERLDARMDAVEPKSVLGKAVRYMINQWTRRTLFLLEAKMEMTNNAAERLLRRLVDVGSWTYSRAEFSVVCRDGVGLARLLA